MSSGTGTHHEYAVNLTSCQFPAEPIGSTRFPRASTGTPGPTLSIMPTPSNPGMKGNWVREPYAPETVTASEGFIVLAIIRTVTSPSPGTPGSGILCQAKTSLSIPGLSARTACISTVASYSVATPQILVQHV